MAPLIPVAPDDKVVAAIRLPLATTTTILVFTEQGEVFSVKCLDGGIAVDLVVRGTKLEF